jgi:hypothetical protein
MSKVSAGRFAGIKVKNPAAPAITHRGWGGLELGPRQERQEGYERTRMDKRHWTAPVARREAAWRLYVEHELKPRVQFYETKRHLNKASALKRALAIHRHQGWRLRVLFAEGTSGERIEAAEINDWCERAPSDE